MIVDSQDRDVDCRDPCSRPGSTDKDRKAEVVQVVDMVVDDKDRNIN